MLLVLLVSWAAPVAAEVVAACEQVEVALPEGAPSELGWQLARGGCRAQLRLARWFDLHSDGRLRIEVCASMEQYRRRTGRPWFIVGALLGDTVVLQPARSLGRVDTGKLVEHELAHWFIRRRARGSLPLWLEEGLAQWLASAATPAGGTESATVVSDRRRLAELERRLQQGHADRRQMQDDYRRCRLLVDRLLEQVGRQALVAALPALTAAGDALGVPVAGRTLEQWLFGGEAPRPAEPGR